MRRQHHYVVAYALNNTVGNIVIAREKKIKTLKDFTEISKIIATHNGVDNIVVTNIMYLGKERVLP